MTASEVLIVASAVVFFAAQVFNFVGFKWRALGSTVGIAMALVVLAVAPPAWEAGVFGWFLACAGLIGKWAREVNYDIEARKEKGKRLLAWDFFGLNVVLNPFFIALYRRRMFRDKWSLKRVRRESFSVPEWLR
ncbi:hypothetical protein GCM10011314_06080 [Knoellia flava]|uniref:Uncharacterized protein n=1 Tax=Knoellia flava TaxID=913969 RepID=A0A8H9KQ24_9MICO|nr:hypothetical protein GCM10011314_06080 [Knoellia flava]